jgi:hypothetical protein
VNSIYILKFFEEFNGKKWECFNSEKICDLKYGRIQGKQQLVDHFEQSNVWQQSDRKVRPLILNVAPPSYSFLKDYRKNMFIKNNEMKLQFKKRPSYNEGDCGEGLSDSETN